METFWYEVFDVLPKKSEAFSLFFITDLLCQGDWSWTLPERRQFVPYRDRAPAKINAIVLSVFARKSTLSHDTSRHFKGQQMPCCARDIYLAMVNLYYTWVLYKAWAKWLQLRTRNFTLQFFSNGPILISHQWFRRWLGAEMIQSRQMISMISVIELWSNIHTVQHAIAHTNALPYYGHISANSNVLRIVWSTENPFGVSCISYISGSILDPNAWSSSEHGSPTLQRQFSKSTYFRYLYITKPI